MNSPISYISNALGETQPTNYYGSVGGGRPQDQGQFQDVPGTNYQYDPVNGTYFLKGSNGTTPNAAPNLAQEASGATITQQMYLQQQQDALKQAAQTRAGQTGLAQNYQGVIAGTAPSVAQTQLETGMGRIAQDQSAAAAGSNGANAFAARRAAANNVARAQGDLSGQQAMVRAGESTGARTGLSQLYGQESAADVAASKIATDSALGYGGLAEKATAAPIEAEQAAAAGNQKSNQGIAGGIGAALMALF